MIEEICEQHQEITEWEEELKEKNPEFLAQF